MSSRTRLLCAVLPLALATTAVLAEDWPLLEAHHPLDGPTISPDGSRVAYAAADRLWVRDNGGREPVALRGTEGALFPFLISGSEPCIGFYH